jgi:hypothetical protein
MTYRYSPALSARCPYFSFWRFMLSRLLRADGQDVRTFSFRQHIATKETFMSGKRESAQRALERIPLFNRRNLCRLSFVLRQHAAEGHAN